jgi:hypothetical protein
LVTSLESTCGLATISCSDAAWHDCLATSST